MMDDPLALTGERTLPGIPAENYWFQRHVAAYELAARHVWGRILEVGCGEGYGAASLTSRGHVLAFEYDAAAARHAHRTYPEISVAIADACRLPVADGSVDAVVALQVLEHLYCADRFISGCRRALRRAGVLVLSTPNRVTFSPEGTLSPYHVYEYEAEELAALLRAHFDDVRLLGLSAGRRLRARERRTGGPLAAELMQRPFAELSPERQRLVRAVRPGHFRVSRKRIEASLDLVALCTA